MKIAKLELFKVAPRWLFLKISTDCGLEGWGEPVIEGRAETVAAAVREAEPLLLGKDAGHIEDIWQMLYRSGFYRGGPILSSAISGIEQALWDIKGKSLNLPVYELLGGPVRERIRVYSWIGGDRPSDVAAAACEKAAQGYSAIKMNGTEELDYLDSYRKIDAAVARVGAIRDALGNDFDIAVDFHGRVHQAMARILVKELEPYRLLFIEEPVLIEQLDVIRELRRHTVTPIATGERNYTRWGFKEMLQSGAVDIIQPDLCHAGGILEVKKIAAMAECYDVAVAPHCPLGPIALAASLQLDYGTPNAIIQEQSLGIHYNQGADLLDYLADRSVFEYRDGYVYRNRLPGLGITINEEKVREMAAVGHDWKNPVWRTGDGVIAEW